MTIPEKFEESLSLEHKILYVLSIMPHASADEVAMEIMELQGTATEESVAELTNATSEKLHQLQQQAIVKMETTHEKQTRYWLSS